MTPEQEGHAARLMVRAQAGDADGYAELLTLVAGAARRYASHRLGDVAWVDDVVQETLVTIHGARRTYDARRPFAPWFYAILSNRMIDVLRKERRIGSREIGSDVLPEPAAVSSGDDRHAPDHERIKAALDTLPAKQRAVISGLKLRDESVKEVGARLGMSESAVKITAHRGYRALRRLLGGADREDR